MDKDRRPGPLTLHAANFQICQGTESTKTPSPRAANGQHGSKLASNLRIYFLTSARGEGRCGSTSGSSSRRSRPTSLWPRAEPAGVYSQDVQIGTVPPAKGHQGSGCRRPLCSEETLQSPGLALASFQGTSWRKDMQQLNHSCRNNKS